MKDKIIDFLLVSILVVALFGYVAIQTNLGGAFQTATPVVTNTSVPVAIMTTAPAPSGVNTVTITPVSSFMATSTFTTTPTSTETDTLVPESATPTMSVTKAP